MANTNNTLTAVTPVLLAQGLLALRQNAKMPMLVNRGYEALAGDKGSTITIPIPSAVTTADVTPAATPPATGDTAPTSVSLALTNWKEAAFYLTDQDLQQCISGTIPMQASEAIKSLANTIDAQLLGLYKYFYGCVGTAAACPFVTNTTKDVTDVRTILNKQLAPIDDRRMVLNADAEGAAANLAAFQNASFSGNAELMLQGTLADRLGFKWFMDQNCPTHTAGTITTGLIAKAATAQALGLKAIVCTTAASTGACALLEGDIITFAGHAQTYVVTANATQASAAADVTVNVEPGLQKALVGSEAVTVKATHAINLGFHRDAIAFASRPFQDLQADALGAIIQGAVDPISGLTLRLEVRREHKRTRWSFDILYGYAVVRKEYACRLIG